MRIVVSNSGVHPEMAVMSARLASTAGVELTYFTSGSFAFDSRLLAALRRLPEGSGIRRTISRRQLPAGLDRSHVRRLGAAYELLHLTLRPGRAALATKVMRRRARVFDRHLGRIIAGHPPDALIAQAAGGACALRAARDSGVTTILNAPIAHPAAIVRILQDEAARNPAWAGTFAETDIAGGRAEIQLADFVFGAGDFTRDTYVDEAGFDPARFRSIPLGVDTTLFTPGTRAHDGIFRVIFVGQLTQRKGLKYLIDAVEALDHPRKELLLVGPPVGDVLAVLPRRPWLRLSPSVPRRQLAELYRQSDVFVLPSLVEGFAQTPLEAMACGLPVIITPNMGVADIVTSGVDAEIVALHDAEAIAAILARWADDPDRRETVGASAHRTAARYSWDEFARRYAAEVLRCLSAGAAAPPIAPGSASGWRPPVSRR